MFNKIPIDLIDKFTIAHDLALIQGSIEILIEP